MIPPVKLFCEMNDIILNWRKINKLLPHGNGNATDEAYPREQIKKMLDHTEFIVENSYTVHGVKWNEIRRFCWS